MLSSFARTGALAGDGSPRVRRNSAGAEREKRRTDPALGNVARFQRDGDEVCCSDQSVLRLGGDKPGGESMKRMLMALSVSLLLSAARAAREPAAPYASLTRQFAEFHDATTTMPEKDRVALFRQRFDALFPGFYEPAPGQSEAQFQTNVAKSLSGFNAIRADYE